MKILAAGGGDGDGAGHGDGYGFGDCSGFGVGDGWGVSYNLGYRSGFGYGDEYRVGTVAGYEAAAAAGRPWVVLRIGCEVHTAEVWRTSWREIAAHHGVRVSEDEAAQIFALLEAGGRKS